MFVWPTTMQMTLSEPAGWQNTMWQGNPSQQTVLVEAFISQAAPAAITPLATNFWEVAILTPVPPTQVLKWFVTQ